MFTIKWRESTKGKKSAKAQRRESTKGKKKKHLSRFRAFILSRIRAFTPFQRPCISAAEGGGLSIPQR